MKVKLGSASGIFEERTVELTDEEIIGMLKSGNTLTVWFNEDNQTLCVTNKDQYEVG